MIRKKASDGILKNNEEENAFRERDPRILGLMCYRRHN